MKTYSIHISNAVSTKEYKEIKSPYSGEVIAKIEKTDENALKQALRNADESYQKIMRDMPAWKRAEILYRVSDLIKENHEELSITIAKEGGKPLKDARVEVTRAINTIKMSGNEALQLDGEQITMDRSAGTENHIAFTIRKGVGPVLAISAFNHPLNLMAHQIGTAIGAGCSVIVKPASQTPISCLKLAEFFIKAGLPKEVISVVIVSGGDIELAVKDPRIRFINFIGGANVGWELQKKMAPGVRLALEHGGTGTAFVEKTADLNFVIPNVLKGAFYHAGQVCVSTQILLVHEDIYKEVLSRLKNEMKNIKTGDPTDDTVDVGPLINPREIDRIESLISEAKTKGAVLLSGGERLENNCYEPTLLSEVTKDMRVMKEEIFGPVLVVQSYSDLNNAIVQINKSEFSFQSSIYTQDIDSALTAAKQIEARAVMINNMTAFRVDWMPFGGSKTSGLGLGGVKYSIRDMTEEKLIVMNHKK